MRCAVVDGIARFVRRAQGDRTLEVGERVRAGTCELSLRRRREGGATGTVGHVGGEPVLLRRGGVVGQGGGERGVHPPPLDRQQVGGERLSDELVAHGERVAEVIGRDAEIACGDGLGHAGGELAVQDAAAPERAAGGARGRSRLARVVRGKDGRERLRAEGSGRERQRAQDAAAFRGPPRGPGRDELVERCGERRPGQLTPCGQYLFGHQRAPRGPFGDQQQ